jgi:transcriptional regulator with XRE-family HTH domain
MAPASSSPSLTETDPAALGMHLKRLRVQRGWTLAELSKLTRLSRPYLSRLESGQRQPSLAGLLTLSRIFDTPIHSLLDNGEHQTASPIVIKGRRASIQRSNGLRYRAVSAGGALLNLSAVHVTVPRRRRRSALARHEGEELLYVLSGTLNLVLENELHTLQAGDSAHFDACVPHRLTAVGDRDAEVLVVAHVPKPEPGKAADKTGARAARNPGARRSSSQPNYPSISVPICAA